MRELRADLREDVHEVVVSAHKMADIGNYVKAYPWLCVGAALAAGFLIVPSRSVVIKPDAEGLVELARRHKLVVKMEETPRSKQRAGMLSQLLGMAASMILQRGAAVVS